MESPFFFFSAVELPSSSSPSAEEDDDVDVDDDDVDARLFSLQNDRLALGTRIAGLWIGEEKACAGRIAEMASSARSNGVAVCKDDNIEALIVRAVVGSLFAELLLGGDL